MRPVPAARRRPGPVVPPGWAPRRWCRDPVLPEGQSSAGTIASQSRLFTASCAASGTQPAAEPPAELRADHCNVG